MYCKILNKYINQGINHTIYLYTNEWMMFIPQGFIYFPPPPPRKKRILILFFSIHLI